MIYHPAYGTGAFATPINTTPFPNNIIPTNRIDPGGGEGDALPAA